MNMDDIKKALGTDPDVHGIAIAIDDNKQFSINDKPIQELHEFVDKFMEDNKFTLFEGLAALATVTASSSASGDLERGVRAFQAGKMDATTGQPVCLKLVQLFLQGAYELAIHEVMKAAAASIEKESFDAAGGKPN